MTASGEYVAPWGQVYRWTVTERELVIETKAKTDTQSTTRVFPRGLAFSIAAGCASHMFSRLFDSETSR